MYTNVHAVNVSACMHVYVCDVQSNAIIKMQAQKYFIHKQNQLFLKPSLYFVFVLI